MIHVRLMVWLMAVVTLAANRSNSTHPELTNNIAPAPDNDMAHVEWFGFVGIDAGIDDPSDSDNTTNYLNEVAAFCNLAHLAPFTPTEDVSERIDAMTAM